MGCCASNDAIDGNSQPGRVVELAVDHNLIAVDNWWKQHCGSADDYMKWQDFLSHYSKTMMEKVQCGNISTLAPQQVEDIIVCVIDRSEEEVKGDYITRATFLRFVLRFGPLEMTYEKVVNNLFSQYMAPDKTMRLVLASWFHGSSITRHEMQKVFRCEPVGSFLVRFSETYPTQLTISVVISAKISAASTGAGSGGGVAVKPGRRRHEGVVQNYLLSNEGHYGYSLNCSLPGNADAGAGNDSGGLDDINSALYPNVFELLSASPQLFKIPFSSRLHEDFVSRKVSGIGAAVSSPVTLPVEPTLSTTSPDKHSSESASTLARPVAVTEVVPLQGPGVESVAESDPEVDAYGVFEEAEEEVEVDVDPVSTEPIPVSDTPAPEGEGDVEVSVDEAQGEEEEDDYGAYGEFLDESADGDNDADADGADVGGAGSAGTHEEEMRDWDWDAVAKPPADALLDSLRLLVLRFDEPSLSPLVPAPTLAPISGLRSAQATLKQIVDHLRFQLESCAINVGSIGDGDESAATELARNATVGVGAGLGALTVLATYSGASMGAPLSPAPLEPPVFSASLADHVHVVTVALQESPWLGLGSAAREAFLDLLASSESEAAAHARPGTALDVVKLFIEAFHTLSRWALLLYRLVTRCLRKGMQIAPSSLCEGEGEGKGGGDVGHFLVVAKQMADHAIACARRLRALTSNSSACASPRVRVPAERLSITALVEDFGAFQHECTALYGAVCLHAATVAVLLAVGTGSEVCSDQCGATDTSSLALDSAMEHIAAAMKVASRSRSSILVAQRSCSSSVDAHEIKILSVKIDGGTSECAGLYVVNAHAWRTMIGHLRDEREQVCMKSESVFDCVSSSRAQQLLADGIRCFSSKDFQEAMRLIMGALKCARCCGDVELEVRAAVNYGTVRYKLLAPRLDLDGDVETLLPLLEELQEVIGLHVYSVGLVRELRSAKIVHHAAQTAHGQGKRRPDVLHVASDTSKGSTGQTEANIAWLGADPAIALLAARVVAYFSDRVRQSAGRPAAAVEVTSVDFERKVLFSLCQILCHSLRFLGVEEAVHIRHLAVVRHLYRVNRVYFTHFIQQLLLICNKYGMRVYVYANVSVTVECCVALLTAFADHIVATKTRRASKSLLLMHSKCCCSDIASVGFSV